MSGQKLALSMGGGMPGAATGRDSNGLDSDAQRYSLGRKLNADGDTSSLRLAQEKTTSLPVDDKRAQSIASGLDSAVRAECTAEFCGELLKLRAGQ
ncbi:hypothetical protein [Streptomyces sp. NPDC090053]